MNDISYQPLFSQRRYVKIHARQVETAPGRGIMARAGFHQNRPVVEIADILRRRPGLRPRPCRTSRARRAARDKRDHGMPDGGARRPLSASYLARRLPSHPLFRIHGEWSPRQKYRFVSRSARRAAKPCQWRNRTEPAGTV